MPLSLYNLCMKFAESLQYLSDCQDLGDALLREMHRG